jgi:hypothetical protein
VKEVDIMQRENQKEDNQPDCLEVSHSLSTDDISKVFQVPDFLYSK